MDAIEKRARELLAAQVRDLEVGGVMNASDDLFVPESAAVKAIIAALTPPDGYVLVPAELLRMVAGCAYPVSSEINPRGYNWSEAYLDEVLPQIKAAMLPARPEVP